MNIFCVKNYKKAIFFVFGTIVNQADKVCTSGGSLDFVSFCGSTSYHVHYHYVILWLGNVCDLLCITCWFSAHVYLLSAIHAENRAAQEARIHAAQQRAENMTQFNDCGSPPPNSFTPVTTSHHVIKEVHPVLPLPSNAAEFQHAATGHLVPDVSPAPEAPHVTTPGNSSFSFCMLHSNSCSGCMIKEHQIADLQEMLRLRESKISKLQKLSSQGNITNLCPVKYLVTALNFKVLLLHTWYWIKRKTKKCNTIDRHIGLTLINFDSAATSGTSSIPDDKLGPLYERSTGTRITFTDHVGHLDIFWWIIGLCFHTHVWPLLESILCVYSCSRYVSHIIFALRSR